MKAKSPGPLGRDGYYAPRAGILTLNHCVVSVERLS